MSLYPPGVTGNEPAIAGDRERADTLPVTMCPEDGCSYEGGDVPGVVIGGRWDATFHWECPACGAENTEVIVTDEPPEPWEDIEW